MNVTCTQENLHHGLTTIARVTSKNTTLPILSNVLLKTVEGRLKLSATDLELGVTSFVGGKVETEGEITVPAKLITEYISALPKGSNISLKFKEKNIHITTKGHSADINTISAADFPVIPVIENNICVELLAEQLHTVIIKTIFAASTDDARPEIAGVYLHVTKESLTAAATDGYRLAEFQQPLQNVQKPFSCIVPVKALQEVARVTEGIKDKAQIKVSENQIQFTVGEISLISRLIDGTYPDYKQIIPEKSSAKAVCSTFKVLEAVKTASLFSREGAHDVTMTFKEDDILTVTSSSSQIGKNEIDIEVSHDGKLDSATFNYKYVLDGVNVIDADSFTLETSGINGPGVFKPTDKEKFTYLVMPIKQ